LRICFISAHNFSAPGGVRSHILSLSKELRKKGHEVTILAPSLNGKKTEFNSGIDNLVEIGKTLLLPGNGAQFDFTFANKGQLKEFFKENKFDIYHFQNLSPMLSFNAKSILKNEPTIVTIHTYQSGKISSKIVTSERIDRFTKGYNHRIFVSPSQKNFFEIMDKETYSVIPNGISLKHGMEFKSIKGKKEIRLLYLGRLEARKGVGYAIKTFIELRKDQKYSNLKLDVVGSGDQKFIDSIEIPEKLKKDIVFHGRLSDSDVEQVRKNSDIYLAPATGGESFGIVLLEAMQYGIPVVAFGNPGYKSVIEPNEILSWGLVENMNLDAMVEKVKELLSSPERYEKLSKEGLEYVKNYDWVRLADKIIDVYKNVLKQKN
jgi:phosphatidylinositol alpha-mannosyltransferase